MQISCSKNLSSLGQKHYISVENDSEENHSFEELKMSKVGLVLKNISTGTNATIHEKGGEIGRSKKCELQIHDKNVSSLHSKIVFSEGVYYISDQESRNGTFVKMDKKFSVIKVQLKMQIEIDDFSIEVIEISTVSIVVSIERISSKEKFVEKIFTLGDKIINFKIDPNAKKGFTMGFKEKNIAKYEFEFKNIHDITYLSLSPNTYYT